MTGVHRPEITGDGTVTAYSEEYGQTMHSSSGAYDEALRKHVVPSGLLDRKDDVLCVLDVGFGLGYNILALLHALSESGSRSRTSIISLEKDRSVESVLSTIRFEDDRDTLFRNVTSAFHDGYSAWQGNSISLLFGDARGTIKTLPDEPFFHAVFHDPFSPSKNPELWTVDFFKQIHSRMATGSVLTTYSAAPQIRGALIEAGFSLRRGPSVGGKREGTLAEKKTVRDDPDGICLELKGNYKAVPYRDADLCDSRESILSRRIDEMAEARLKAGRRVRQV